MQTITAADSVLVDTAPIVLHLYLDGAAAEYEGDIISASYTAAVGSGDFSIGNACAASCQVVLSGVALGLSGKAAKVTWSVGSAEYPLITGTVEKTEESNGQTTITIYDLMYTKGAEPFTASADHAVLGDLYADIAAQFGVDNHFPASTLDISGRVSALTDMSLAQAAGAAAALRGRNVIFDRSGNLREVAFSAVNFTTDTYEGGAQADAVDYSVTGLSFTRTNTTTATNTDGSVSESSTSAVYSAGETVNLAQQNELAKASTVNYAYSILSALGAWRTGTYSIPGGLLLEPGDLITVDCADGVYKVPVIGLTLEIDGGCKATITAGGKAQESGTTGTVNQQLSALHVAVATLKNLVAENAKITSAYIEALNANQAWITNLFAGDITASGTISGVTLESATGTFKEKVSVNAAGGLMDGSVTLSMDGEKSLTAGEDYSWDEETHSMARQLPLGLSYGTGGTAKLSSDRDGMTIGVPLYGVKIAQADSILADKVSGKEVYTPALYAETAHLAAGYVKGIAIPQMQHAIVTSPTACAVGYTDIPVTFPTAFAGVPSVAVTPLCSSTVESAGQCLMYVVRDSVTASGFTIRVRNSGSATVNFGYSWIATHTPS